jgi:Amt family ammonium transporter
MGSGLGKNRNFLPMTITLFPRLLAAIFLPLLLLSFPSRAAAAPATATPTPTLEQRVAYAEAERTNSDPAPTGIAPTASPSHTAWMMVSAALVLFMTLPGLVLFYGGLVRHKNVLSMAALCLGITALVAVIWWAFGYSLVFGKSFAAEGAGALANAASPFLGGTEFFFLKGVGTAPNTDYAFWIPQNVFCIFQLTFAIITPVLIFGASAERMKFTSVIVFAFLWFLLVYVPLTHMVWGATGFLNGVWNPKAAIPAIDFAGGMVVEMACGWSALVLCLILGKRRGFGREPMMPHSMVLASVGTGILWVGWYGFNAGSALAADGIAANAFLTTTLAGATASLVWPLIEFLQRGKPSVLGFCSGVVAGLVGITPACGFVDAGGAVIIGAAAGLISYLACTTLKRTLGYDDTLDVFGVHGVSGTVGLILTGILATSVANPNLLGAPAAANGLKAALEGHTLWLVQLKAIGTTLLLLIPATLIITLVVRAIIGLRPGGEIESQGLDIHDHGEEGYTLNG